MTRRTYPRRGRRLPPETIADMERMLRNGSTFASVAYECDVNPQTVANYAKRWGISPPPLALSEASIKGMELVKQGYSYNAAARAVGVHSMQIIGVCRTRGIPSPYQRNNRIQP